MPHSGSRADSAPPLDADGSAAAIDAPRPSVLVVDDEEGMRSFLSRILDRRGWRVATAGSAEEGATLLAHTHIDLIILDIALPGRSGLDWLKDLEGSSFTGEVILITAFADMNTAIDALRAGAADFVLKPFRVEQILNSIGRCLERARLTRENFVLRRQLSKSGSGRDEIVGQSDAMVRLRALVRRVAPTPSTVLIQGESGVGKELVARALHELSPRAGHPFVALNCAAISVDLIEAELFGHAKGAFTGAKESRKGLFYYAHGGTLFLDEIGELPAALQSKLLRALEERRIRPVGAEQEVPVDVRVVAATNRDLKAEVAHGRFRQDLFYRLEVMTLTVPPLRRRAEDVPDLTALFMRYLSIRLGVPPLPVTPAVTRALMAHSWPGNVRELRNFVERSLLFGEFPLNDLDEVRAPRRRRDAGRAGGPAAGRGGKAPHPGGAGPMRRQQDASRRSAGRVAQDPGPQMRRMGRLTALRARAGGVASAFARSVRFKLMTLVLAPLLLGVPVLLLIVWAWGTQGYDQLLVNKVSSDLGTARQYFDRVQGALRTRLEGFASSHRLALALERRDPEEIRRLLAAAAEDQGLDYLLLLDAQGRVRAGGSFTDATGPNTDRSGWSVVREALQGDPQHGLEVFPPEELDRLGPALRNAAHTTLIPTRNARPDPRATEERGLMIQAAVPIAGADGTVVGALESGVLLNGNQGIVDRLNSIVYQDASLPLGSQGTATLFLGDTRIATNVRLFAGALEGKRALGTRASRAVADRVLGEGLVWLGSAFVVDDTYVSGYQPLTDTAGQRIGMLYVGFLEAPLRHALYRALAGLFLLFLLVSGLGTLADLRWARAIFRPLERMNRVIARIEAGEDSARVGPTQSRDELGRLARAFDHLLDSIAARRWELQRSAEELDRKVALRTAALEEANATLRRAQQQLVMNEKLTAIGELTAGVAHEINNPVAVIQGNLDLLREVLGDAIDPVREEIRLIDEQTQRIHAIVTKLLQFARPGDFAGYAEAADVNAVLADCLVLTRHNLNRGKVAVDRRLEATSSVEMNRGELQQVLINLIVNAMQAMPDGGTLTLESRDIGPEDDVPGAEEPFEGALLRIGDTGHGIAAVDLDRIFDPFFTTKNQTGTGLGLSISYAIVQRYGGRITVESTPGRRTVFTLWLRRQARYSDQPSAPLFAARLLKTDGA